MLCDVNTSETPALKAQGKIQYNRHVNKIHCLCATSGIKCQTGCLLRNLREKTRDDVISEFNMLVGTRFGVTLFLQMILLLLDLILNTASVFYRDYTWTVLGIFVFHALIIIIALILMLTTFFSTYVFKVGLVDILVQRFRCTILILFLYFLLTITYYIWTLVILWGYTTDHRWGNATIGIYVAQKAVAPIYYYYYKRSALRISDPRFYEDIKWEQHTPQQANK